MEVQQSAVFRVVGYFGIGCPDLSLLATTSGVVLACTLSHDNETQNQDQAPSAASGSGMPSKRNGAAPLVTRRNSRMRATKKLFWSACDSVCHLYVLESVMLNARGYLERSELTTR